MKSLAKLVAAPEAVQEINEVKEITSKAVFLNRDQIELHIHLSGQRILSAEIKSIACPECLEEIKCLKQNLKKYAANFLDIPLPEGPHHSAMLVREILLKLRGAWQFPYQEAELCHCRNISTETVDTCILNGIHNVLEIGEKTMAGTACGTCRPVTQMLIDYRLNE